MSHRNRRFRFVHLATLTLGLGMAAVAGCSADTGSDESNVTDVQHTDVKDQSIGNCWIYASVGWAESLHLRYSSTALNVSESYITYWHWFEQIVQGDHGHRQVATMSNPDELTTGGFWGVAGEIMLRYGMMEEGTFIPEEAESIRSARQRSAKNAINASLKDGVLSDPEARRDPSKVRAELDAAWELTPEVVDTLNLVFGERVERTVYDDAPAPETGIFLPRSLAVGHLDEGGTRRVITLADAIGTSASWYHFRNRSGEFAWNAEYYPSTDSSRRDFQVRMQRAMHASQPVLLSWLVDFNAMSGNHFMEPPATPGRQGGHLIVVEDYQINNVPGYGTLEAGTLVLDPVVLEAALAPEAELEFIRIKNSWGESLAPDNVEQLEGYHDLYMKYLNGPIAKCHEEGDDKCARTTDETPLRKMILPPERFMQAAAATCDANVYQSSCSGSVLQWCDGGVLERFDCASAEWSCGYDDSYGDYDCLMQ
ncbi:MAG: hypothetical protein JRI23_33240 [Deltaproteobacteria bacterium]|nr:hypothetical protein [Deltaproteobacteria bacterium]MBW2537137.1 hypothetical protein [Deltaproteobacteria bacterium]